MLAPRYATTNKHNWKKPVTTYQDMEGTATLTSTPYATLTESGSRAFYGNYNFLMTFKKNFSGHDLKLILGAERNTYDYKYLSAYRQVFNYPDYEQIDVGEIENMDNSGHRYEWAIQSILRPSELQLQGALPARSQPAYRRFVAFQQIQPLGLLPVGIGRLAHLGGAVHGERQAHPRRVENPCILRNAG